MIIWGMNQKKKKKKKEDLNSKSASATDKLSDFQNVALPWGHCFLICEKSSFD